MTDLHAGLGLTKFLRWSLWLRRDDFCVEIYLHVYGCVGCNRLGGQSGNRSLTGVVNAFEIKERALCCQVLGYIL